jgi:sterol desaturase/sphingolipid hydroxylase (fatty acid hydroxylase superfamily)
MDKNYGQIFIFWDKWFGTFQEELPACSVYGITRPVKHGTRSGSISACMAADQRRLQTKNWEINLLYGSNHGI